jgi:hypothetical protein
VQHLLDVLNDKLVIINASRPIQGPSQERQIASTAIVTTIEEIS